VKHLRILIPLFALLNSPTLAQEQGRVVTELPDGSIIAAGKWSKTIAGPAEIPFGVTFASAPLVVVSPNFVSPVGGVETIGRIDRDKFQVNSTNLAPGFFINWIAIGKK
jgi:hypothetical protein